MSTVRNASSRAELKPEKMEKLTPDGQISTYDYTEIIVHSKDILSQLSGLFTAFGSSLMSFSELHEKILCDNSSLALRVEDL